jgi:hypothetical protein
MNYVARMQTATRRIGLEQSYLVDAILRGLKPSIRLHVLHAEIKTVDDILHHAKISEAFHSANAIHTNQVNRLTARVETLLHKLSRYESENGQPVVKIVTFSQSTVEDDENISSRLITTTFHW